MPAAAIPLRATPVPFVGARWAVSLCVALLTGFALLAGRLWFGPAAPGAGGGHETVIQQPVGPADFPPERPAPTAPDPGDNL